jgi:hypothetical protein
MKWTLQILALVGTTVFGVFSSCWIVVASLRLESDFKDLVPDVLAFEFF